MKCLSPAVWGNGIEAFKPQLNKYAGSSKRPPLEGNIVMN